MEPGGFINLFLKGEEMKRQSILALVIVILYVAIPWASANPTLDQYNPLDHELVQQGNSISTQYSLAQTFTSGYTGYLTSIELLLVQQNQNTVEPLVIEIRELVVNTGHPIGNLLAQTFLHDEDITTDFNYLGGGGWNSIDFSTDNVFLDEGTQYSIVLWSDAAPGSYVIRASSNLLLPQPIGGVFIDWYVGGEMWIDGVANDGYDRTPEFNNEDLMFRTYVVPIPTPSAILLGSIGVGFVTWLRRRKTL